MQIELSPITGVLLGINYAYYEPTDELGGLHMLQICCGLFVINITWAE
jgi:hypothetical protein